MATTIAAWLLTLLSLGTADHPKASIHETPREQIKSIAVIVYGTPGWQCLDRLIYRESRWKLDAANPTSSARGLFQILNAPNDLTIDEQWDRGRRYLASRYDGDPCKALDHSLRKGWY